MREKPKDKGRLLHILDSISNINAFLKDRTAEDFLTDKMLYFAIVKNMEIIGEASYMLTNEFKASTPHIDWKDIITMRHILVHGYYHIDSSIVWQAIHNDLPQLKIDIEKLLEDM